VVHADEEQSGFYFRRVCGLFIAHGALNLWTTESWLAAQTARTMRKTKPER
jgi:hypothetical protein